MRNFAICGVLMALVVFGHGCQAENAGKPQPGGATTEVGLGGINANLKTLGDILNALDPFVSDPGKPLLVQAKAANADAAKSTTAVQRGVNDEKTLTDKQIADLTARVTEAENNRWLNIILDVLIGLGVLGFAASVAGYGYTKLQWTEYAALACGTVTLACIATLTMMAVLHDLKPYIELGVGIAIVLAIIALVIAGIYEWHATRRAVPEIVHDSIGSRQPTVPYSPTTQAIITNTVGQTAAMPDTTTPLPVQTLADVTAGVHAAVSELKTVVATAVAPPQ